MIPLRAVCLVAYISAAPRALDAQSGLLTAIEGSAPAPVLEPTAGVFSFGLSGLWFDPTISPRTTGAFFGVYQATYASVRVYHAAIAFRAGPRWSIVYAQSEIPDLFDSSLTSADPGLASLRARAVWGALDATAAWRGLTGNLGVGLAEDDNVGDLRSSTVGRFGLRVGLWSWLSVGIRGARVVGGSVPAEASGRLQLDALATRAIGDVEWSVAIGAMRGLLWRFSETRSGFGVTTVFTVASRLDLGVGAGRYTTNFGATGSEWSRSAAAGLRVASVRVGVRYSSTQLGAGSGYGISIGYEPQSPR